MNCPQCSRTVAKESVRCPYCGGQLHAVFAVGSGLLRPQATPADAYSEAPLVDQEHALRRLRAAWRNAHVGFGQLISLVGDNGIGRSRLIRELATTIDEEAPQARWLLGQAHSYATYLPFGLLADLLTPGAENGPTQDALAQLADALEQLAEAAPTTDRWSLLALAREARATTGQAGPPLGPLVEVLTRALWRAADGEPLVIVLEDLEWADAASLLVLDALLPKLAQGPALILCTHHGDWSHEWPEIARHMHLLLGPLSQTESLQLIAALPATTQPTAPSFAATTSQALALATGGNPLLLEQATLAVIERGDADDRAPVPATLAEAILTRLAALSPVARQVLCAAAALGQRFPYRAVAMITEADLPDRWAIDAALRELTQRRLLLRWRGGPEITYHFAHGLIQEVAYSALPATQQALIETRVADWLLAEQANSGQGIARVIDDLEQRQRPSAPATEAKDRLLAPVAPPIDLHRRGNVLARIILADLSADQRASLAFCLQHGYSYAEAGELLGIGATEVREHLYQARKMFKRLHEASALAPELGQAGDSP